MSPLGAHYATHQTSSRAKSHRAAQHVRRQAIHMVIQRAMVNPHSLNAQDVQVLQRTVGNRATANLLTPVIQTQRMALGPANDAHEREADQVADQVIRRTAVPSPRLADTAKTTPVAIQRWLGGGTLQRRPATHGPEGGEVDPTVGRSIQLARGKGRPLDEPVRRRMEQGFGADFSAVRIHTDPQADTLNRSLNAKAFTTGSDLFFRQGAYNPGSQSGQRLLAHELTHTIQQGAGVQRAFQLQREFLIQRDDDDKGVVGKTAELGDIGGAIVDIYETVNGDESASSILKAITQLSGGYADTTGGGGDMIEGATKGVGLRSAKGIGSTSRIVGGATQVASKGSGMLSSMMEYGQSALNWVSSWGYGSDYMDKMGDACAWLGGWAKSASDLVKPYAFYTELVASGSKAVSGVSDGWNAGYVLEDLSKLAKNGGDRNIKEAAKLLFDVVWWKRLEGYAKGGVGAVEGAAAIFLGPLSKGIATVMTKTYESGWAAYILRAIGSSASSSVWSNAQVKQQMELDQQQLMDTVAPIVANSKIKDIVELYRCATGLGIKDLAAAILKAFATPPRGKENRYKNRYDSFEQQAKGAGIKIK